MYKKEVLANGLKIITHDMPGRQSAALGIWINTGGRYEFAQNKGISHYLEHLLFKGSKKYSCRKIKESVEGIGGSLNGFTSEELTCYLVKIPDTYLNLALDILTDMVLNPLLSAQEITKERTVILEELKMYKDQPQSYVYELLDELMWPNQPLGTPIIGSVETVSSVDRETLLGYKEAYYTPSNIVVSAAGSLDQKKLIKGIEKIFSKQKAKQKNKFVAARSMQTEPRMRLFHKETEQTHLALGFHGFPREHALKHAQGLLHVVLGGNMSSRLFNEVREKRGLAYEIGTSVRRFYDTGAFIVHAGIDNRKVNDAIPLILKELKKIRQNLVTADEFKRAKEFYVGQLRLALEDTMDHMLWIGESVATQDKVHSLDQVIKEVSKVTREDLAVAAERIFKRENLNLSLIGPLKNKERQIEGLLYL